MNRKIVADLGGFIQMRYGVQLKDDIKMQSWFTKLVETIDEQVLRTYFGWDQSQGQDGGYWTQQIHFKSRQTGQKMVDTINAMGDNVTIIDVGCGDNEFKQFFGDRLIGLDPYNEHADLKIGIDDLKTDKKFDVVLILGSLNFGDETTINRQFVKAYKLCKPGGKIFLRANPGITHDHEKAKWIDFYEWSFEKVESLAEAMGATIDEMGWDHAGEDEVRWGNRIYAQMTKSVFNK